jgi:hypothetical protein
MARNEIICLGFSGTYSRTCRKVLSNSNPKKHRKSKHKREQDQQCRTSTSLSSEAQLTLLRFLPLLEMLNEQSVGQTHSALLSRKHCQTCQMRHQTEGTTCHQVHPKKGAVSQRTQKETTHKNNVPPACRVRWTWRPVADCSAPKQKSPCCQLRHVAPRSIQTCWSSLNENLLSPKPLPSPMLSSESYCCC